MGCLTFNRLWDMGSVFKAEPDIIILLHWAVRLGERVMFFISRRDLK